jgi:hypothetical protein
MYISSHSADVILSEIRPIKLHVEALRSINVLLDEFLYSVLNAARSLSTDKLRAGLLKVLPTSLGKDALLEAEVELRAYWDRTVLSVPDIMQNADDQGMNFHLQWAFEVCSLFLLDWKCSDRGSALEAKMRSLLYIERIRRRSRGRIPSSKSYGPSWWTCPSETDAHCTCFTVSHRNFGVSHFSLLVSCHSHRQTIVASRAICE